MFLQSEKVSEMHFPANWGPSELNKQKETEYLWKIGY